MDLPTLGLGLNYFPGVEPLLSEVDYLEVEPQVLWHHRHGSAEPYHLDRRLVDHVRGLPMPKLVHSVANPLGGARSPDPAQLRPLLETISLLQPPWASEHLSYNAAEVNGRSCWTGFLLPVRQTAEGVDQAVEAIRGFASGLPVPFAIETGVSYLRPRSDELSDGAFVAKIAQGADCGILLDLHNIWTNERNGREPVLNFLREIPLERVWEVHLAGGFEEEGVWLDAHSGEVPRDLLEVSRHVLPQLPNLRSLTFELYPSFLGRVGLDRLRAELRAIRGVWDSRDRAPAGVLCFATGARTEPIETGGPAALPKEWEDALAGLVLGATASGDTFGLASDPAVRVYRDLLGRFRSSMAVRVLKLSCRLIVLSKGRRELEQLLEGYWRTAPPTLFSSDEGAGFGAYLLALDSDIPWLREVIEYELAVSQTLVYEEPRVATFGFEPFAVLNAPSAGVLPTSPPAVGSYEVEIQPEPTKGPRQDAPVQVGREVEVPLASWQH
jgi:uncharacterized protein